MPHAPHSLSAIRLVHKCQECDHLRCTRVLCVPTPLVFVNRCSSWLPVWWCHEWSLPLRTARLPSTPGLSHTLCSSPLPRIPYWRCRELSSSHVVRCRHWPLPSESHQSRRCDTSPVARRWVGYQSLLYQSGVVRCWHSNESSLVTSWVSHRVGYPDGYLPQVRSHEYTLHISSMPGHALHQKYGQSKYPPSSADQRHYHRWH